MHAFGVCVCACRGLTRYLGHARGVNFRGNNKYVQNVLFYCVLETKNRFKRFILNLGMTGMESTL